MPPRQYRFNKFWNSGNQDEDFIEDDALMEDMVEDDGVPMGDPPGAGDSDHHDDHDGDDAASDAEEGEEELSDTDSIATLDELEYPRNCLTMLNLPREATCVEVLKFLDVPRTNIITLFIHTPKEEDQPLVSAFLQMASETAARETYVKANLKEWPLDNGEVLKIKILQQSITDVVFPYNYINGEAVPVGESPQASGAVAVAVAAAPNQDAGNVLAAAIDQIMDNDEDSTDEGESDEEVKTDNDQEMTDDEDMTEADDEHEDGEDEDEFEDITDDE